MRTDTDLRETPGDQPEAGAGDVVAWREKQLLESGFDHVLAASLAGDCAVDLHALVELVERGCRPDLAARILAPLPGERKSC